MASALTDRLSRLVKTMRGQARITEDNVQDMLREVRMALLEADVALPVVRDFVARVKASALGSEVVGSLSPGQAFVGVVNRELAATMGEGVAELDLKAQPPAVILMAGLQGAGKTTTTAKLAKHLLEKRRQKVLTVSGDVYRPAAIDHQGGRGTKQVVRHRDARIDPCRAEMPVVARGPHRDADRFRLRYQTRHRFVAGEVAEPAAPVQHQGRGRLLHRRDLRDGRQAQVAKVIGVGDDLTAAVTENAAQVVRHQETSEEVGLIRPHPRGGQHIGDETA